MTVGKGPSRFRDFVPPYEPVKKQTLTASGTIIPGSAGYRIVVEYHTQQNLGSADLTTAMLNGTVSHNENLLPYTPGQNFLSWGAPFAGREFRCDPGTPFVVTLSTSGSVVTNTRYWFESYP